MKPALPWIGGADRWPFPQRYGKAAQQFVLLSNRATIYLHLGELDKAEAALAEMKRMLIDPSLKKPSFRNASASYETVLVMKQYNLNILRGDIEGAQVYLKAQAELSIGGQRLSCLYFMGLASEKAGQTEQAMALYKEVAENGGTTWVAAQSRERLMHEN